MGAFLAFLYAILNPCVLSVGAFLAFLFAIVIPFVLSVAAYLAFLSAIVIPFYMYELSVGVTPAVVVGGASRAPA